MVTLLKFSAFTIYVYFMSNTLSVSKKMLCGNKDSIAHCIQCGKPEKVAL